MQAYVAAAARTLSGVSSSISVAADNVRAMGKDLLVTAIWSPAARLAMWAPPQDTPQREWGSTGGPAEYVFGLGRGGHRRATGIHIRFRGGRFRSEHSEISPAEYVFGGPPNTYSDSGGFFSGVHPERFRTPPEGPRQEMRDLKIRSEDIGDDWDEEAKELWRAQALHWLDPGQGRPEVAPKAKKIFRIASQDFVLGLDNQLRKMCGEGLSRFQSTTDDADDNRPELGRQGPCECLCVVRARRQCPRVLCVCGVVLPWVAPRLEA